MLEFLLTVNYARVSSMLGFVALFGLFHEICPDYVDFQTPIRLKVILCINVSALHLKYLSDRSCVLLTQKNIHITLEFYPIKQ